ncbi:unnamed protein product [Vicia faba]|uniref:Uncharacterized protein n=1 Tax=Vicia faba TaxID=3906 RepID=A0AAV0YHC1_VICFA|nr:unnamed protein product [Vicia faba]
MESCLKEQEFVINYSNNHINMEIIDDEGEDLWMLTGLYGFPEDVNKRKTWKLLKGMKGVSRIVGQMNWGRETMAECGLQDLGFDGYPFTWTNGRQGQNNIQCRLDRIFANEACVARFHPIKVTHLSCFGSDHATIRVVLEGELSEEENKNRYIFRFEDIWARDEICEGLMKQNWRGSGLTGYKKEDANWDNSEDNIRKYKALENQRQNLLKVEEIIWRQRNRALWLQECDKNTKFFHGKADQRRRVNRISKLKDDDGRWWRGIMHCERILTKYFKDIFSSSNPSDIMEICLL